MLVANSNEPCCETCGCQPIESKTPRRRSNTTSEVELFPCPQCRCTFYCSRACLLLDLELHTVDCEQVCFQQRQPYDNIIVPKSLGDAMTTEFMVSNLQEQTESSSALDEAKVIIAMLTQATRPQADDGDDDCGSDSSSSSCSEVSALPRDHDSMPNVSLLVALLQKLLGDDRRLFKALCLEQPSVLAKTLDIRILCRDVMATLLDTDMEMLKMSRDPNGCILTRHCHNKTLNVNSPWFLASCQAVLELLRAVPGEEGTFGSSDDGGDVFGKLPTSPSSTSLRWNTQRVCEYLHLVFEDHLFLLSTLLERTLDSDSILPPRWQQHCYFLWHQLVESLKHPKPAQAVLWGADQSVILPCAKKNGFKNYFVDLLLLFASKQFRNLSYYSDGTAKEDPLHHYPYQVAALLVAHSERLEHDIVRPRKKARTSATKQKKTDQNGKGSSFELFSLHTEYLHDIILEQFDGKQVQVWNNQYLPWALEVCARAYTASKTSS